MALTLKRIVETAIDLVDDGGPDALTMRRLAARLDVATMTTYHHIGDRDELVGEMAAYLLGSLAGDPEQPAPDAAADWATTLTSLANNFLGVLRTHPASLTMVLQQAPPEILGPIGENIIERLRAGGLSRERAELAVDVAMRYLIGAVVVEQDRGRRTEKSVRDAIAVIVDGLRD